MASPKPSKIIYDKPQVRKPQTNKISRKIEKPGRSTKCSEKLSDNDPPKYPVENPAPAFHRALFEYRGVQLFRDRGITENKKYKNIYALVVFGHRSFPTSLNLPVKITDCNIDRRGVLTFRRALWVLDWKPLRTELV